MRWLMLIVFFVVIGSYVLKASGAVEFRQETTPQTAVTEKVSVRPVYHQEKLEAYFSDLWSRIRRSFS